MTVDFVVATDGSAAPNPGPGTYDFIIRGYEGDKLILERTSVHVVEGETTNNRMEMAAILFSIYAVDDEMDGISEEYSPVVELISDSQNAISWLTGEFRVNEPEIAQYVRDIHRAIADAHIQVKYIKVPGHSHVYPGMPRNLRMNAKVDQLLREIRKEQ